MSQGQLTEGSSAWKSRTGRGSTAQQVLCCCGYLSGLGLGLPWRLSLQWAGQQVVSCTRWLLPAPTHSELWESPTSEARRPPNDIPFPKSPSLYRASAKT